MAMSCYVFTNLTCANFAFLVISFTVCDLCFIYVHDFAIYVVVVSTGRGL